MIINFAQTIKKKKIIQLPIAHNEGNYFANKKIINDLEDTESIAFKYCSENGEIDEIFNPNGSSNNIAGVLNPKKNILGLMPHPERSIDKLLSGEDGSILFQGLVNA